MAYCKNCGAYIPDGHTKCLACGLEQDEYKKNNESSGSAAQTDPRAAAHRDTEDLRRRMEEQRKKQQENSRRWAEAERERRRQQQEQQAREREAQRTWSDTGFRPERKKANKTLAALSYLPVLFVLPFLFAKDDGFALYHAKQGALLFAVSAAAKVLGSIFGLGWIATLFQLYWIYKGMTNASAGKIEPLPYIGDLLSK